MGLIAGTDITRFYKAIEMMKLLHWNLALLGPRILPTGRELQRELFSIIFVVQYLEILSIDAISFPSIMYV